MMERELPRLFFSVDKEGNRLVGQPAQRQMVVNPRNTFFGVKRLIGRSFSDNETGNFANQVNFKISPAPNGDAWVETDFGKKFAPSEIAAQILMRLKEVSESHLGEPVTRAVITVPAYFDNHQRQATEDAGRIAGLKVERIINEPTAAALAYGLNKDEDKTIVVYDLGGGTFDVSILTIGGGVFEVKSTAGDTFLGGEDFNFIIIDHVLKEFQKKSGVDLKGDRVATQRIREACETAKHDLSTKDSVTIHLPYITAGKDKAPVTLDVSLTKAKFEELSAELIKRTIVPCKKALQDAGLKVEEVDDVILVGGQTRMPKVREAVKNFFKKEPVLGVNPDEAVALGAAIQGNIISNQGLCVLGNEERELVLVDVTPLNLGIEVVTQEMAVIVPAQTPIPCKKSHEFTTCADMQTSVQTMIYQGNRPIAKQNRLLGEYTLSGIAAAPAGVPKIEVTFDISADGLIRVSSMDKATKQKQSVTINLSGGLSEADIERMKAEAESNASADAAFKDRLVKSNEVSKKIQTIKTTVDSYKSIAADVKAKLTEEIEKANLVINNEKSTSKQIEDAYASLKAISDPILTSAYHSQATSTPEENKS
jgi:molecular chaperone DnaK